MQEGIVVSLGSNCEAAEEKLKAAREGIETLSGIRLLRSSPLYKTEPQEYKEQPWFLNQVLLLSATDNWSPKALLQTFLNLEKELGRIRDPKLPRFGPRAIDIDLLLFGEVITDDPICTLPHPRMLGRAFVLVPLFDIAPELRIAGKSIKEYLQHLSFRIEGKVIYQD